MSLYSTLDVIDGRAAFYAVRFTVAHRLLPQPVTRVVYVIAETDVGAAQAFADSETMIGMRSMRHVPDVTVLSIEPTRPTMARAARVVG